MSEKTTTIALRKAREEVADSSILLTSAATSADVNTSGLATSLVTVSNVSRISFIVVLKEEKKSKTRFYNCIFLKNIPDRGGELCEHVRQRQLRTELSCEGDNRSASHRAHAHTHRVHSIAQLLRQLVLDSFDETISPFHNVND